jgi:hypothetical protein
MDQNKGYTNKLLSRVSSNYMHVQLPLKENKTTQLEGTQDLSV